MVGASMLGKLRIKDGDNEFHNYLAHIATGRRHFEEERATKVTHQIQDQDQDQDQVRKL